MNKILLLIICCVSANVNANPAKATPEEEQAIFTSLTGMMTRLADPASKKQDDAGCWLNKDKLVKVGGQTEIDGVKSTCVSWESGVEDQKAYMFFPTRLKNICDKAEKPYLSCI